MSSNLYPTPWGEPELALTAQAGIAYLELWASPLDCLPDPPALERLGATAQALGLHVWSLHAPYGEACNLASADETGRGLAVSTLVAAMDRARAAGASLVVVHSGLLAHPREPREPAVARAVRSLNELCQPASERGLALAVEYLPPGTLALGAGTEELLSLRSLVDGEIGFCADVVHMHPAEDPATVIRALGGAVATVHLSDNDGVEVERHWLPGKGQIKWPAVLSALDEVGYQGPMLVEAHTGYEPDLPRVLAALAACGHEVLGCQLPDAPG